jgi:hypothetical protein
MNIDMWKQHTVAFRVLMLERLKGDCEYYLGYGGRSNNALWADDPEEQIQTMTDIWNSLSPEERPRWLRMKDIQRFAEDMGVDI